MTLNRELMSLLKDKMGNVSGRRVYQKLKEIENDQLLSREESVCFLAHTYNIPLRKYFDEETIKDVRDTIQKGKIFTTKLNVAKRNEIKETVLKLDSEKVFKSIKEPLIPQSIIADAKKMASYYPVFYIFENSIRNFIMLVMEKKHGKDWWMTEVINNQHLKSIHDKKVEQRKTAENENRYHGKRGAHEIFYTDLEDLYKIIDNNFPDFGPILNKKKSFYEHMIETINLSRRIIAHNNPLNKRDFDRIKHAFNDWCDQLNLAKETLR